MTRRVLTDDDLDRVYLAICHAAAAGEPCPSSVDLAKLAGARSHSSAQKLLDRLVADGAIRVDTIGRNRRVVTVTATGHATAVPPRTGGRKRREGASAPSARARTPSPHPEPVEGRRAKHEGPRAGARCQWIAGEPCGDDACKCLAPVVVEPDGRARPYCADHLARSIRVEQPKGLRLSTRRLRSRLGVLMGDAP